MSTDKGLSRNGAALIIVLLMALLLSIIATAFVNFQVMDRRMSQDEINSVKSFMMADSGISYALCHLCRDSAWQGQDKDVTEWVYQEGHYRYGFRVKSNYNAYGVGLPLGCPYSYIYLVRSAGVVVDTGTNPRRFVSRRCVRAYIQCTNDYNFWHLNPTGIATAIIFPDALLLIDLLFPTYELNVRPDQCHFTATPTYSAKTFLLRYCEENE